MGKRCEQTFLNSDIQMAKRSMRKLSNVTNHGEMQIKTSLQYHLIPVKMACIKNTGNSISWQQCAERGTLIHC